MNLHAAGFTGATRLPSELSGARPYPLPAWARRPPVLAITLIAAAAILLGCGLVTRSPVLDLATVLLGLWGVGLLWWRQRARELLQSGLPVVGSVNGASLVKGSLHLQYSYEVAAVSRTGFFFDDAGNVVRDFGLWPGYADLVFLVVDRSNPKRRAVWGFAHPPGHAPRPIPSGLRPLPAAVVAAAVGTALVIAAWAIVWFASAFAVR